MKESRIALVTGAADGIGAGIVRRLVEDGLRVMVADIDDDRGPRSIREFGDRAAFVRADVSRESDVVNMIARARDAFGPVDVLVNNAWGGGGMGRVERKTNDLLRHGLDVAFYGAFWAMREVFPDMKAAGWGGSSTCVRSTE